MTNQKHLALLIKNSSNKEQAIDLLKKHLPPYLSPEEHQKYTYFSDNEIEKIIEEEDRYDKTLISNRKLITHSSGERKKLLINHFLKQRPEVIVLDNPLDHLDSLSRKAFVEELKAISTHTRLIQLSSRASDFLPFIEKRLQLNKTMELEPYTATGYTAENFFDFPEQEQATANQQELIRMEHINIRYEENPVINDLSWTIKSGDFWQLSGPNGSGKSSLLALITGDSTKGYGQDLYLFGKQKGSGESVWEIKKKIGYFAPHMTTLFTRGNTLLEMILSGYYDSVGLYDKPTSFQLQQAKIWLKRVDMLELQHKNFNKLSQGLQRLSLIIRAIIKNPPLLILDEPTDGLDDQAAALVVDLINKLKDYTEMAIIFVSHREEPGLKPNAILELTPSEEGSVSTINYLPKL